MKIHRTLLVSIFTILILSLTTSSLAAKWESFSDIEGHWAQITMQKGFENGLIKGFDDNTIRPDDPITSAQMITIITRLLGATESMDLSQTGLSSELWYYEAAGKALHLGLISSTENLDTPMTRQEAIAMTADGFSLVPATPDMSLLSSFKDSSLIEPQNRAPMASLIAEGVVEGFAFHLFPNENITRAEFITILYRIAQNYKYSYELSSSLSGGTVVKGSGGLYYATLSDDLWFDCSSSSISLSGVEAPRVFIKSHRLSSLSLSQAELDRLVIDSGSYNLMIPNSYGTHVETLQLDGNGSALAGSWAEDVEITGSGLKITLEGKHKSVIISGSDNTVSLSPTSEIGSIIVTGKTNRIECIGEAGKLDEVTIAGSENILSLKASELDKANVDGTNNALNLEVQIIDGLSVKGNGNSLTAGCTSEPIPSLTLEGSKNDIVSAADHSVVSIPGDDCNLELQGSAEEMELSGKNNELILNCPVNRLTVTGRENVISGSGILNKLILNALGCRVDLEVTELTDNSAQLEKERVLSLVSSSYKGNYTLEWAQEHDYEDFEKEVWVNAKDYSSETDYLIWVNLSMQRVNIFKGERGNWKLVRSSIIGSGAPKTPTPVGVWKTTYKQVDGWTTSTYTVKPVVRFKSGGYAFHSRIFYPGTTTISDPSIGFPVSHGCIRMYDEDICYIYDNIPTRTTVVVF